MCPADIIRITGKSRLAAPESDPGQLAQAINELADQWAAWRVPQPPNAHAPKAEILPFPLKETLREQYVMLMISKLNLEQIELLCLIGRAFQPQVTEKVPDGPDAELIRQCNRVNTVETAIAAVCEEIPDGDEKGNVIGLLTAKWIEARSQIFQLDGPSTLQGARAAAEALLTLHPGGIRATIQDADLPGWLALRCAQFLVWEAKLDDHDGNESESLGAE